MSRSTRKPAAGPRRRRYLVHVGCAHVEGSLACRYVANIRLWTRRNNAQAQHQECAFVDEYELIEALNPLLPHGSDVRDVLSHIESPEGFLYLLNLSSEEASRLGWRE
jgi:hypothetical protein